MIDSTDLAATSELQPQLLYRIDGKQAQFATWRLADGHETLALFATAAAAEKYRAELAESTSWIVFQPPRDKLIDILHACRAGGLLYAALDPLAGQAKTLFDIPRVLAAVPAA